MGLLTVDVTSLGIVMTGDSQAVDLYADRYVVHASGARSRNPIVKTKLDSFSGVAGFVGTELLNGRPTREWLEDAVQKRGSERLSDFCEIVAEALTAVWTTQKLETHLSVFVAGYENGSPRFWWVSNGEAPDGTPIPVTFDAVDGLDSFYNANANPGESLSDLIVRMSPSFRRGVLSAAAIFDSFRDLVNQTVQQGHREIPPIGSLDRFEGYALFRFEFTKRLYDPKKGLGIDPHPPVAGVIHIASVDPTRTAWKHDKNGRRATMS